MQSPAPRRPRVLALTRYSRLGPSSRYRFYQFQTALAERGIDVTIEPLLGDWYMNSLNAKRAPNLLKLFYSYARRIIVLLFARQFDAIWIEREALPFVPWPVERLLLPPRPIVLDFDDEPFLRYRSHPFRPVRALLGGKIASSIRHAAGIICGNDYLMARIRDCGAERQILVPTVVDTARYSDPARRGSAKFTVGWIGTRGNVPYLDLVRVALQTLASEAPVRVVLVGAPAGTLPELRPEIIPWSEATEATVLSEIDVGIMPLPDAPFERGKCGLKLLQYMASGKATIASPVGANQAITREGETGFLAATETEWVMALRRVRDDPCLRSRLGETGRRVVEHEYSVDSVKTRLADFLASVGR